MKIHAATAEDRAEVWEILAPVIRAGETYALPRDMDSLVQARVCGFKTMQFNFVAWNEHAARLWRRLGLRVVGTLPGAFDHPCLGLVDALVMFREL